MAKAVINLQKESGGIVKISPVDGIGVTEVTVPESGELATKEYVDNTGAGAPKGLISMWSGSIATIPNDWALCDGTNGTPDLRGKFVVGAGSSYSVGNTGGSKDAIVVSHTHTGSTNTAGAHSHVTYSASDSYGVGDQSTSWNDTGGNDEQTRYDKTSGATNTAGDHTHSLTINSTGSDGTNANLPPYYALAFIMKL